LKRLINILTLFAISVAAICFLFPIYWMVVGSFEHLGDTVKIPPHFLPYNATLENYIAILFEQPFFHWIVNSLVTASAATLICTTSSCLAGYAFAKKEFPFKNIIFWVLLSAMMIPSQVVLIPLFITMKKLGLYNTYPGVFLPSTFNAGYMFLARQYFSTIPSEFIDAARMDGASEFRIFLSVIVPISKPLIAALSIFCFVGVWSSFLWPLIITSTKEARTLPVAVATVCWQPEGLMDIGLAMAGATLVAIPMYIFFFSFQKYFVKGITLGGVKG